MADGHGGTRTGSGRPRGSQNNRTLYQAAKARKETALAALRELDLARRRGEMIPRTAVIDTWARAFLVVRGRLLALPSKIAGEAANQDAHRVHEIVKREVYAALTEIANCDGLPTEDASDS
jgi:hypothetical protein